MRIVYKSLLFINFYKNLFLFKPFTFAEINDMAWKKNILETIGNTPMIRLNKIARDFPCTVLAKVDYFNPGNSIKDRMALKMIEDAEKKGLLKSGRRSPRRRKP